MKKRIALFISIYLFFVLIFLLFKVIFFWIDSPSGGSVAPSDLWQSLWHGLPLDLSMSGYLAALPALLLVASPWIRHSVIEKVYNIYFGLILTVVTVINIADVVVYPYWGYHFDSSVFLYLQKPADVLASASFVEIGLALLAIIVIAFVLYVAYARFIRRQVHSLHRSDKAKEAWSRAGVMLLLAALLFLPIRGGVTVSTMNVGRAYFSDNMFLNHAAINPVFNLMSSAVRSEDFGSQYQFYDKEEAVNAFAEMNRQPQCDSIPQLLNTDRPNIIFFMLESFSASVAADSAVAPNMVRYANEGIRFENFYANSFRTDRGLVSILSGYPAHPTTAVIKYPDKTRSLPSIPRRLKEEGYTSSFAYGGDADFANMRSYMVGTCGISDITSDSDFPVSQRLTKWGVPDKYLFDEVYKSVAATEQQPFLKLILTLSSHEPFDVPISKFEVPFLNAVSYTDQCLGDFVERLRATPLWNNTLIVLVADHCMQSYPQGLENNDPQRFHIPMIWIGGAVREHRVVSDYGSQNDIAATLLSQLKLKHSDFNFSKDMLNPQGRKFAFYSYVNGFAMRDTSGHVVYDNERKTVLNQDGTTALETDAKVFFQNMYIDLGSR